MLSARWRAMGPLVGAVLAGWGAGCVVPVGPQFQDPLAAPNYAPRITYTNPPEGSWSSGRTFQITVTDSNVGDTLFVRWIAEYPDYQDGTRTLRTDPVPPPTNGNETPTPAPAMTFECDPDNPAENGLVGHQILVVVADQPFTDSDKRRPDMVKEGGLTDRASWTLNYTCPPTK
jgi:hypothetical protein